MRNLVIVLGDQLSHKLTALDGFDPNQDSIWMAEVDQEATQVWCHKSRLVFFFSAMRHFRDELRGKGFPVLYHQLSITHDDVGKDFSSVLSKSIDEVKPQRIVITEPGDWYVNKALAETCERLGIPLEQRVDRHFYCSIAEFRDWAEDKKSLVLEHFYRWMRKKHNVLVDAAGKPAGGDWNFDKENRKTFGKSGPGPEASLQKFLPDSLTREVVELVESRFGTHPGRLDEFSYPVTAEQARASLKDFVIHRLPNFGDYQDAMWTDTDFLNHSRLSAVINVHLLDPAEVVQAALDAFETGHASINNVEGFVRQVIGWREFVRGIYWTRMPGYVEMNSLKCDDVDVPQAFWDGETEMNCIHQAMQPVLKHAYAHHIQRLMVLGLFAQLLGVHPRKFHDWHMAMYADAVDWVSLPNTLGMSQHGDGGVVGTKPYCASGSYIDRMSNYCKSCRFNPKKAVGSDACPVTTMYWDFLARHEERFAANGRMLFQIKNLRNKPAVELAEIRQQAHEIRSNLLG